MKKYLTLKKNMNKLNFLNKEHVLKIKEKYSLPVYIYSEKKILEAVNEFKKFPSAFWYTTRYAMKANSNINILRIFNDNGIKIDASSEYEVYRAIDSGFKWEDIQLSTQETSEDLEIIIKKWIFFVATSLYQLEIIWKINPWSKIWVRINPGLGSAAFKRINTWGITSSFGIWYEYIDKIKEISQKYDLHIVKIHIHIWSENTPESWVKSASLGLKFVNMFNEVKILNMWWGFKKAIMPYEESAQLISIWNAVKEKIQDFYNKTWRKIHIELEPWKYMVINSCSVIWKIIDIVDTWNNWYKFLKTNTWMTEMPRVTMYWIQQPIIILNNNIETEKYIVVWHCCESWDILTSGLYNQEEIEEIILPKANIWDTIVFEWVWAYNSSMSMKNYNSFPEAWELFLKNNGEILEIRKRENRKEVYNNEISIY